MEPLEAHRLPWAQGVVSSNLAAPTKLSMILRELIVSLPSVFPVSALNCAKTVSKPRQFGSTVSEPFALSLAFRFSLPCASLFICNFI